MLLLFITIVLWCKATMANLCVSLNGDPYLVHFRFHDIGRDR